MYAKLHIFIRKTREIYGGYKKIKYLPIRKRFYINGKSLSGIKKL